MNKKRSSGAWSMSEHACTSLNMYKKQTCVDASFKRTSRAATTFYDKCKGQWRGWLVDDLGPLLSRERGDKIKFDASGFRSERYTRRAAINMPLQMVVGAGGEEREFKFDICGNHGHKLSQHKVESMYIDRYIYMSFCKDQRWLK